MKAQEVLSASSLQRPSELSRRRHPSQLLGHFVMGRSVPLEPPGWHREELRGWTLVYEPSLPVQELLDSSGDKIGWLLGHAIDLQSESVVTGSLRAPVRSDSPEFGRAFEEWLYLLGGRFAAIVLHPKPVLYPDAVAVLPVLFDAELECAASSPFLLCSPDGSVPDSPFVDDFSVFDGWKWYTLGTTSHARAELLLPNHSLDLVRWEQSRAWPQSPYDSEEIEPLIELVATTIEKTLAILATDGRPNAGLTAGGDSRSVLACSREHLDRIRFFTVAQPDWNGAMDLATAPALAKRFGLDYRVLPWIEPSASDIELFIYRTGCLIGEPRGRRATPTYNQLKGGEVYVSALGSEIARGYGWRRSDDPTIPIQPEDLLRRFDFSPHPELVRRAADWIAALPEGIKAHDAMTLFNMESIWGPWGGPLTMAYPEAYSFTLYPYAHRTIIDAVLRLPWDYRESIRLREDIIAARWRELLDIPFNRPPVRVAVRRKGQRAAHWVRAGLSWKAWKGLLQRTRRQL